MAIVLSFAIAKIETVGVLLAAPAPRKAAETCATDSFHATGF